MSDWTSHVKPAFAIEQSLTAIALLRLADIVDSAVSGDDVIASPTLSGEDDGEVSKLAWMTVAILLVDQTGIHAAELRLLANNIWKGTQDVIF